MRDFDEFDFSLWAALWEHYDAMVAASGPAAHNQITCYKRVAEALISARRNYSTYDDMEVALEEALQQLQIWRISHDPAYDPDLHETSPGLERP